MDASLHKVMLGAAVEHMVAALVGAAAEHVAEHRAAVLTRLRAAVQGTSLPEPLAELVVEGYASGFDTAVDLMRTLARVPEQDSP